MFRLTAARHHNWFGRRLKLAREAARLSQEDLAERLNITRLTVARYESGRFKPSFDRLEPIAAAVSRPLWWFFTEDDQQPELSPGHSAGQSLSEVLERLAQLEAKVARQGLQASQESARAVGARESAGEPYIDSIENAVRRGWEQGRQEGLEDLRASILEILHSRFADMPTSTKARIHSIADPTLLRAIVCRAATAAKLDDLFDDL